MGENKGMDGKAVVICGQGGLDKVSCSINTSLFYVMLQVAKGVCDDITSLIRQFGGEVKEERGSQHGWRGM